jgi:hypothetical protein
MEDESGRTRCSESGHGLNSDLLNQFSRRPAEASVYQW